MLPVGWEVDLHPSFVCDDPRAISGVFVSRRLGVAYIIVLLLVELLRRLCRGITMWCREITNGSLLRAFVEFIFYDTCLDLAQ